MCFPGQDLLTEPEDHEIIYTPTRELRVQQYSLQAQNLPTDFNFGNLFGHHCFTPVEKMTGSWSVSKLRWRRPFHESGDYSGQRSHHVFSARSTTPLPKTKPLTNPIQNICGKNINEGKLERCLDQKFGHSKYRLELLSNNYKLYAENAENRLTDEEICACSGY